MYDWMMEKGYVKIIHNMYIQYSIMIMAKWIMENVYVDTVFI